MTEQEKFKRTAPIFCSNKRCNFPNRQQVVAGRYGCQREGCCGTYKVTPTQAQLQDGPNVLARKSVDTLLELGVAKEIVKENREWEKEQQSLLAKYGKTTTYKVPASIRSGNRRESQSTSSGSEVSFESDIQLNGITSDSKPELPPGLQGYRRAASSSMPCLSLFPTGGDVDALGVILEDFPSPPSYTPTPTPCTSPRKTRGYKTSASGISSTGSSISILFPSSSDASDSVNGVLYQPTRSYTYSRPRIVTTSSTGSKVLRSKTMSQQRSRLPSQEERLRMIHMRPLPPTPSPQAM
jgi:hypothetical protein